MIATAAGMTGELCYLALGSNLGHRSWHLCQAVHHLRALSGLQVLRTSSMYTTKAQYVADQPAYLNAVVEVELEATRSENLPGFIADLKSIEDAIGRRPGIRRGPRVVDLDIIAVGSRCFSSAEPPYPLEIPHACMHERDFVLVPLVELAPEWRHPGLENQPTATELLHGVRAALATGAGPEGASADFWPVQALPTSGGPYGRPIETGLGAWRRGAETLIMGILNVTPDSFSDGGDFVSVPAAVDEAAAMVADGAHIVDIGGESTRPGAEEVPTEEEVQRVVPVVKAIRERGLDVTISVDTRKAAVAQAAVEAGADWINDVSGGEFDPEMLPTIAALGVPCVLMHMRGTPETMKSLAKYDDVVREVVEELLARRAAGAAAGIAAWNLMLDPGLGFAKTGAHNLSLLKACGDMVDCLQPSPVLIGASRKRFLGEILGEPDAKRRVFGTAATTAAAVVGRADIVRVHDVRAMAQTAKVSDHIFRGGAAASKL